MIARARHRSTRLLAVAGSLAVLLAGCGSDKEGKPIPRVQAAALQKQLDAIERRFDFGDGACADIRNKSEPAVQGLLQQVPRDVDADVRNALNQSFDNLFQRASEQCDTTKNQRTTPKTTPRTTPQTQTETAPQTQTETAPQTQTETTPAEKPGKGNGKGKGKAKGQDKQEGGGDGEATGGLQVPP